MDHYQQPRQDHHLTTPGQTIEAVVKWFNLTKGFGFVSPANGMGDAFLHLSVLSRAGLRDVAEGTVLLVDVVASPKGPQVTAILEQRGMAPQTAAVVVPDAVLMTGEVKWYKIDKGFGFIVPEDGGGDVFIHRSVVLRAGRSLLETGAKVTMKVHTSAKGREAVELEATP